MALGNVFIRDVDGNIPYDTGSSGEKVTGLLFDVSLQPELFTEGYGKTNESKLRLAMCVTSPPSSPPSAISASSSVWRQPKRKRQP